MTNMLAYRRLKRALLRIVSAFYLATQPDIIKIIRYKIVLRSLTLLRLLFLK